MKTKKKHIEEIINRANKKMEKARGSRLTFCSALLSHHHSLEGVERNPF